MATAGFGRSSSSAVSRANLFGVPPEDLNPLGRGPIEAGFARRCRGCAQPEGGEVSGDTGGHVSLRCVGIDMREEAAARVPGQHGSRVAIEGQHALRHNVRVAVVSAAAAAEPTQDRREREHEEDDQTDRVRSKSFQQLCLLDPSGVPSAISCRSEAPIETCAMPCCRASWTHWVPLPAPGGPASTTRAGTANTLAGADGRAGRGSRIALVTARRPDAATSLSIGARVVTIRAHLRRAIRWTYGAPLRVEEKAGAQVGTGVQGPGETTAPLQKEAPANVHPAVDVASLGLLRSHVDRIVDRHRVEEFSRKSRRTLLAAGSEGHAFVHPARFCCRVRDGPPTIPVPRLQRYRRP
jgi:hypothetical protein